ncbi:helix-turn-helix domain-containing protein [Bacillus kwashiorkori]|uniref:helix-turn-helix domain-containing protein n=1 Tax=Bacillus kwashiorkori TaxID=1522318 RepID=UPI0007841A4D|nr:helix-turn-helix transcriptional regulator [Bacillus kwashiorkori]
MDCTVEITQRKNLKIDGTKIRLARVEKDWTISKLANESGVTRKTIGEIERGNKKRVRLSTIQQLAISLEKDIDYFCTHIEVKGEELNEF